MRPWQIFGLVALLLILIGGVRTAFIIFNPPKVAMGCDPKTAKLPASPGEAPIILDLGRTSAAAATQVKLMSTLCMVVGNVVTREKLDLLQSAVTNGKASVKKAEDEVKAATTARDSAAADKRKDLEAPIATARAALDVAKAALTTAEREKDAASADITLALFLNDKSTPARAIVRATEQPQRASFDIEPNRDATSEDAAVWRDLIGGAPHFGSSEVQVGIGAPTDKLPDAVWSPPAGGKAARLDRLDAFAFFAALIGFVLLFVTLFLLDGDTGLLRNGGAGTAFSLSRVQMAFWMTIGLFGFVFIWCVTGQYFNVMTQGMFTLMGIAGATGLVAQAIPAVANAGAQPANQNAQQPAPASPPAYVRFVQDIITSPSGQVEIHRVQLALWTLVIGAIVLWYMFVEMRFVDLDANLLILMGISSGVYAGAKITEK